MTWEQLAASHTRSLAGREAVWHGFFAQTGAVPVYSLEEMANRLLESGESRGPQ
ncbi:MAG: hypothetical protein V1932_01325 [Chloroflexota bacterium]